ncbi:MAG: amino acid adenylation domain-containing protein [Flavobacterium sp.]|uniref:amino acid adenylation domain-containing protein n=1 Tax=Flavobacterium sp. TaxID=239 RepID=UPI001B143C28|nr:amino acid adenylation domain-containing protein [Flavobacterium sp.]MBO9586225.1 amino acid adenylation domain-containing protein [Flavobacterium sp.]
MKLTLPQQDVYFEQLLLPNEPIYNIGAKIEIKGVVNFEVFNKAYIALINQHDVYRVTLEKVQEDVTVKVLDKHHSQLGFVDFSQHEHSLEEVTNYMQKEFMKPFDLFSKNLLHVFTLVKVEENFYYLFSVYHHIITDGWGTSLMFQRLVQNYNEILESGIITSNYPFTYKDFITDDATYQNSDTYFQDKAYWTEKFSTLPENLFEKIDDTVQINKSNRQELIVNREIYNQLNELSSSFKCSTFNIILAALYTYFGRKHQNNDFAIGLPVLNRSKSVYKKTVGLFMGISPLRIPLDFEQTFENLIVEIKNQLRKDYRHQRFPLGKLIQELKVFNEKERLFNITLSYEKQNFSDDFKHTKTQVIPLTHQSERVALAIYIREFDESEDVKIDFDYNLNYFDDKTIKAVVNHFENLIHAIIASPDRKLKEFDYLTEEEKQQILVSFNETAAEYPKEKTTIDLFVERANETPQKIAIKDDLQSYTYQELNSLSDQFAEYINVTYLENDKSPIAVLLGRSANMVAVLLGILKSGRAYIPLDPNFPLERLSYIVENSQSKILITEKDYRLDVHETVNILTLESILADSNQYKGILAEKVSPKDTAYIIYTSGSTGNPKGVEIGHESLLNFLISIQQKPGVSATDILFSVTTYSFDISILEFFVPLISGALLYIANQEVLSDPHLTIKKIEEIQPTIIQATPSFYQLLYNADWQGSKRLKLLCGGDLLSKALAEKLIHTNLEVWNMYGPTETTIWSSLKKIENPADASNIGKPINNTQFYILDEFLKLKPIGTPGAIYIAGDGLAKGYYNNETLTKEKFIQDPFNYAGLCYETGDVGKWNENGEIEFLGRNDNQVKIRGYRIELGDIESQLNKIKEVKDAVVIAKKGNQQEAFLVAYLLKRDEEIDVQKILEILKNNLPYYMIPNTIIPLEAFPLTPNQKVDRKSLAQKNIQQNIKLDDFKAPASDLEKKISEFWQEVLNINQPISTNDNFFFLGGHSLNAIKLIGLIVNQLFYNIGLKAIFDYPTIQLLAAYLQALKPIVIDKIPVAETKDLYNLTPQQYAIWLASQFNNTSAAYNMSAGYQVEGSLNVDQIKNGINSIIKKYEIVRTNFIETAGVPHQKRKDWDAAKFSVSVYDVKKEEVNQIIEQLVNTPFDLEKELLIRVQLLQLETGKSILLFSTHHIIMDGLSLEIFIQEFIKSYNSSKDATEDRALKIQFKDYSEWYNKAFEENVAKNELFWSNYLEHYEPKNTFERDSDSKNDQQTAGQYLFEIAPSVTSGLKKIAGEEQVTFYTVLLTAINVLVHKLSNQDDICIGTVNSGRNRTELNDQIGMFVQTLILRTKIEPNQTFIDILKNTHNNLLEINDHQDVPFNKLSQSIFDLMVVYQNPEFSFENIVELNNVKLNYYPVQNKYSRMPLVFNFIENDHKLKGIIEYNADLFDQDSIHIIALRYSEILHEILKNPLLNMDFNDYEIEVKSKTALDFDFNF